MEESPSQAAFSRDLVEIGERIRFAREKYVGTADKDLAMLAESLSYELDTYYKIEAGQYPLSLWDLAHIIQELNIDYFWLMTGIGNPPSENDDKYDTPPEDKERLKGESPLVLSTWNSFLPEADFNQFMRRGKITAIHSYLFSFEFYDTLDSVNSRIIRPIFKLLNEKLDGIIDMAHGPFYQNVKINPSSQKREIVVNINFAMRITPLCLGGTLPDTYDNFLKRTKGLAREALKNVYMDGFEAFTADLTQIVGYGMRVAKMRSSLHSVPRIEQFNIRKRFEMSLEDNDCEGQGESDESEGWITEFEDSLDE